MAARRRAALGWTLPASALSDAAAEQRLRGLERAPRRVGVAGVFLARHRVEAQRERLARHPRIGVAAHGVDEHRGRGLGHPELLERDADREGHLGHRRIEAVALGRDGERGGAEEIAVVDEVLVVVPVVIRLAPGERPELREQIDAPPDDRLLRGRLERGRELRALRLEQLAGLRAVDRRQRARHVSVAQVDRREDDRPRLERAPRLGPLFARWLHPRLAELVAQHDRPRDPVARGLGGVGQRGVARLEQPPAHGDPLEAAGALDLAPGAQRVARPGVERGEVVLRVLAIRVGADQRRQVVERAGAPLVAAERELVRGGLDRVAPGDPEGALQRFVGAHQVQSAADGGQAALGRARLESLVRAHHLPRLDRPEAHRALGRGRAC